MTSRDFKGVWVPREIYLDRSIGAMEKLLWAEIHSLYDRDKGGCYASNEYLAEFMGVKERRLQEMISTLKAKGLIVQVSFDGRSRVIKAILPQESFDKDIKEDYEGAGQGCRKVHLSDAEKCTPRVQNNAPPSLYRDISLEQSIESSPTPSKGPAPSGAEKEKNSSELEISPEAKQIASEMIKALKRVKPDYEPRGVTPVAILTSVDLMLRKDKRSPRLILDVFRWAVTDNFWSANMFKKNPAKYLRDKFDELEMRMNAKPIEVKKVDRRTLNKDGTPIDAPHLKDLF